jgi:hypothetical protein
MSTDVSVPKFPPEADDVILPYFGKDIDEDVILPRKEIIDEITEDLTETQKIRLEKLSESVEAGDIDEFRYKTEQLKESFFSGSEQTHLSSLSEEVFGGHSAHEDDTSPVSQYAKFLSKTVFK